MNIYFCGSILGGREDAPIYAQMIRILKEYGPVLTEHVGDLSLTIHGEGDSSRFIWKRDTDWLRESDLVIAECSRISMGVGYELAFAEALGKPVHVFFREGNGKLSCMIDGNPSFHIHRYRNSDELPDMLRHLFET